MEAIAATEPPLSWFFIRGIIQIGAHTAVLDIGNAVFVEYLGFGDDARFVKRKAAVAADVVKIGRGFFGCA